MMPFNDREKEMSSALVKCGEIRSRLRGTLNQLAAWSDMEQFPCKNEAALRKRMAQIHQVAQEMKDYEP